MDPSLALMPFGNSRVAPKAASRRDILRIAQRFNAGSRERRCRVPKARLSSCHNYFPSAVPSGLIQLTMDSPGVKTPGYFQSSLRDDACGPLAKRVGEFTKGIRAKAPTSCPPASLLPLVPGRQAGKFTPCHGTTCSPRSSLRMPKRSKGRSRPSLLPLHWLRE